MPSVSWRRREQVAELLKLRGYVSVEDLSKALGVSAPTIRKDLTALEHQGLAMRTHGGAVLVPLVRTTEDLPFARRADLMRGAKERIGRLVADAIEDHDTVIFDASSTVWFALPFLAGRRITLLTNVAGAILDRVAEFEGITLISTGGLLRSDGSSFCGPLAEDAIAQFWADKAFISPLGISIKRGFTHANPLEAHLRRRIIEATNRVFVCADHSKFGHARLAQIAPLSAAHVILTDVEPADMFREFFDAHGIEVRVAQSLATDGQAAPG
ncbi:MAG: DeoR/GlpR family DNA-binding transcription regulator [Bacillota bacterium]